MTPALWSCATSSRQAPSRWRQSPSTSARKSSAVFSSFLSSLFDWQLVCADYKLGQNFDVSIFIQPIETAQILRTFQKKWLRCKARSTLGSPKVSSATRCSTLPIRIWSPCATNCNRPRRKFLTSIIYNHLRRQRVGAGQNRVGSQINPGVQNGLC